MRPGTGPNQVHSANLFISVGQKPTTRQVSAPKAIGAWLLPFRRGLDTAYPCGLCLSKDPLVNQTSTPNEDTSGVLVQGNKEKLKVEKQ